MDDERLAEELALLQSAYPDLAYLVVDGAHWVRIPAYAVPTGWMHAGTDVTQAEIAFQIPVQAGQAPYAFYARPPITLTSGDAPGSYTATVSTPWGDDFAQFSWTPSEPWIPKTDIRAGANMLNFARSLADRLADLS